LSNLFQIGTLHFHRDFALDPIRRLPTLMLTSSKHQVDINAAFEHGANAYLAKPESVKELTSMLGEFKSFWLKRIELPEVTARKTSR
jgi:CheY-like chemotaxis protein